MRDLKILETVDNSPCSKTLTIEIPRQEIGEEIDSIYKDLTAHAEIPGFRPGHAPLHLLKLRFGRKVELEGRGKAVEKACQNAIEELKLRVVGEPKVDVDEIAKSAEAPEGGDGEPLKFNMELEFVPEFDIADYKGFEVEIPRMEVKDEDVEQVLDSYQKRFAILVPAPDDRKLDQGDIATLDVVATCEGEPFPEASHEGYRMDLGAREHLPGFEDGIKGMTAGEEKTIDLTLPEDYSIEKYRGKKAEFKVVLRGIHQRQLPEIDDEFAKDLGFDSLEALRKRLRDDLEREMEIRRKEAIRSAIRNRLEQANAIPVPESMVNAEFDYINALQNMELARMGASFDALGDHRAEILAENRTRAEKRVRTTLLLEKIAEKEEIKLGETEFLDYLEGVAVSQGDDPDRFVGYVHKKGLEGYYQRLALERKVLDSLMIHAKVKEVEPAAEAPEKASRSKKKTSENES